MVHPNSHQAIAGDIFLQAHWLGLSDVKLRKDNLTWLSNGKLRVSYGLTGNNRIGDYDYMARLYASENTYKYPWDSTFYPGYYVSSIANPNLKWETTEQYDFGLDLGFWMGA